MFEVLENMLTFQEFCMLTNSVGWGAPPKEQVDVAIKNSLYTILITENDCPVGMGRLCGDKSLSFYVKDVVVKPDKQGQGIGKLIMSSMINYVNNIIPIGWKVSMELMSSLEAEKFYEQFGFDKRPTKEDGAGMFLTIEKGKSYL